jgi:hypothetical protein
MADSKQTSSLIDATPSMVFDGDFNDLTVSHNVTPGPILLSGKFKNLVAHDNSPGILSTSAKHPSDSSLDGITLRDFSFKLAQGTAFTHLAGEFVIEFGLGAEKFEGECLTSLPYCFRQDKEKVD